MIHDLKSLGRFGLNSQFLPKLSFETLFRALPVFYLSPWEFPQEATARGRFSLNHENPAVAEENPRCNSHDHRFSARGFEATVQRLIPAF
jgi:hypothetical protein